MLLYIVVHVVDKKDWVVDMVWSVRLELGSGKFEPFLEQKGQKYWLSFR